MKERGIIFNSEMVRAILDGRKTQTRRVMKSQPEPRKTKDGDYWFPCNKTQSMVHVSDFIPGNSKVVDMHEFYSFCCPYGGVGDRLWVRETWQGPLVDSEKAYDLFKDPTPYQKVENCVYKADGGYAPEYIDCDDNFRQGWRPSSNMPRWASRITLEITNVRVERLQDITLKDAIAEGMKSLVDGEWKYYEPEHEGLSPSPKAVFCSLWNSIYGDDSWSLNPWVWVIEFKRV